MVRSVDTFFIDGESFISYCSDSDFDYAIYIGQKCKVLRNEKSFIGRRDFQRRGNWNDK